MVICTPPAYAPPPFHTPHKFFLFLLDRNQSETSPELVVVGVVDEPSELVHPPSCIELHWFAIDF